MQRISTTTKKADLFGAGKHGFTEGIPNVEARTLLNGSWFNGMQEEMVALFEELGFIPQEGVRNQAALAQRAVATRVGLMRWDARTPGSSYTGTFRGGCARRVDDSFGADVNVIVGDTGEIQTSPDTRTWTHRSAAASYTGAFADVCEGAGLFVAVGASASIQTSVAGTTWAARSVGAGYSGDLKSVAIGPSGYVAVGSAGGIQSSPEGVTWTSRSPAASYAGTFTRVRFGGGLYVAIGSGNEVQTSPDGATWTRRATDVNSPSSVPSLIYGHDGWIVPNALGVAHSADGITWTPAVASLGVPTAIAGFSVGAYANGVYAIPASAHFELQLSSAPRIATRPWSRQGSNLTGTPTAMFISRGRWVCVGQSGLITVAETPLW